MIDNIIVRLHGTNQPKQGTTFDVQKNKKGFADMLVPEHFDLYKKILKHKNKGFTMQRIFNQEKDETSDISDEEFLLLNTSKKLNQHYLNLDKIHLVYDNKVKERNLKINGKYRVPSSEHDVVFSINPDAGWIEFNINIPKVLFGHNLAQFIPQISSKMFHSRKGNFEQWKVQKHYLFDRLEEFIDEFFTNLFIEFELELMPNYDYIELVRIDLCFNQYFKTKTEALMYLDEQKKIHKKRSNAKAKSLGSYETSIEFHTSNGSYFKIYHKGSEYINTKHGDFNRHQKLNKEFVNNQYKYKTNDVYKQHSKMIFTMFKNDTLGKLFEPPSEVKIKKVVNEVYKDLPINTMFLKNEMDKVLRYEISLTTKSLARTYKTRIFRRNCRFHQEAVKTYNSVRRHDAKLNKKSRHRVTQDDRRTFKEMARFINNSCYLLLSKNKKYHRHAKSGESDYYLFRETYKVKPLYAYLNKGTLLETRDIGFFTKDFLKLLVDDFFKLINQFQLEELQPYDDLVKKVRKYNEDVEKNLLIYNDKEDWQTWELVTHYDHTGKPVQLRQRKMKGNKRITKASQLLTESQRRKMHLQSINITNITEIFRLMHEKKMTPSQIKKYLNLTKSSYSRRMAILKQLGVKEQSLNTPIKVVTRVDFFDYYFKTGSKTYRRDFYLNPRHKEINSRKNDIQFNPFYKQIA